MKVKRMISLWLCLLMLAALPVLSLIHIYHRGHHHDHDAQRAHGRALQVAVRLGKPLFLKVLAHERLDDAHVRQVLLDLVVQAVHLGLHPRKPREARAHDRHDDHRQQRDRDRQHDRQRGVHGDGHDQRADQHPRRAKAHAHQHVDHVHDLGDVVGQARDQRAGGEVVDVCKRELLNLAVDVAAQVGRVVDRRLRGEVRAADAAGHHQNRRQNHQPADAGDVPDVLLGDADVDDVAVQARQQDLAEHFDDHAQRPDDEVARIRPRIVEPSLQGQTLPFLFVLRFYPAQVLQYAAEQRDQPVDLGVDVYKRQA